MASKVLNLASRKYALALIDELLTKWAHRWLLMRWKYRLDTEAEAQLFNGYSVWSKGVLQPGAETASFIICVEMKFFSDLKNNRPVVNQNKNKNAFAKGIRNYQIPGQRKTKKNKYRSPQTLSATGFFRKRTRRLFDVFIEGRFWLQKKTV